MALAVTIDPVLCLPIAPEVTTTEQEQPTTEEELQIVSVVEYQESPNDFPVAMNKKKLSNSVPPEDPTTKVPSM